MIARARKQTEGETIEKVGESQEEGVPRQPELRKVERA